MNNQNIKLVSSLITKNHYKLIFVSKFLFQKIKLNNKYLDKIYNYINIGNINDDGGIILKYCINFYKELLSLNHKFSNAIFNKLHNIDYRYDLDLDLVKDLNELKLINKYNFSFSNYDDHEILKYLISVDFIDKNKVMRDACSYDNFKLFKFLVEEMNIEVTCENSIYACRYMKNGFVKYIFSKISKHKLDFQQIIVKVLNHHDSNIVKYLTEDLKITIEKSTIEKIFDSNNSYSIIDLIKSNCIVPNQEIFNKIVKAKKFELIEYLYHKYKFNISKEDKYCLIRYYITNHLYSNDKLILLLLSETENEHKNGYEID